MKKSFKYILGVALFLIFLLTFLYYNGNPSRVLKRNFYRNYSIGDLLIQKNYKEEVTDFIKVVGFLDSTQVAVALREKEKTQQLKSNWDYRNAILNTEYFNDTITIISIDSLNKIVYSPPEYDNYYIFDPQVKGYYITKIINSPFGGIISLFIWVILIWGSEKAYHYIKGAFTKISKPLYYTTIILFLIMISIVFRESLMLGYTRNGDWKMFEFTAIINYLLSAIPIIALFHYLNRRVFTKLDFFQRETSKIIFIITAGVLIYLVVLKLFFVVIPILNISSLKDPSSSFSIYYTFQFEYIEFPRLIKELLIIWTIIALGIFINNLRKHILELVRKEKTLKRTETKVLSIESELNALQARVNPHFLYNSLNSLASLAQVNPGKTEEMALKLSAFYRQQSKRKGQNMAIVREEIDSLKQYLEIEKIRFGEKLIYDFQIGEETLNKPIPQFLLQPIVENAIKYGYDDLSDQIIIKITAYLEGNTMNISVYDQGIDFTDSLSTGYGIESVRKKLKLVFPEGHELQFINSPKKQVKITLYYEKMRHYD